MNAGMEYGASWSLPLTMRMVATMFLAPFISVALFVALRILLNFPFTVDIAIAALPVVFALAYLLRAIRGFVVSRDAIFVRHMLWTTCEPLTGLKSIAVEPDAMADAERLRSSLGGLGTGAWYWSARFGRFRGYLTNRTRLVVLRLERGVIVLSPDDPDAFVRHLEYFRNAGATPG
ncbi:MAG: hypothetical protein FJX57_07060 [Alphaproteobacteria bacterium]|nr:hypothetical protein [Alphaproteobacteria bacterium]